MSQDLITLQEAADLIGKNLRTIQRYIKTGKLTRHDKDGKTYVSRDEVKKKFNFVTPSNVDEIDLQKKASPSSANDNDFQIKWIEEIEKHAQTREELGAWKGRAEAYQSFASRLLSNGNSSENAHDPSTPEMNKNTAPTVSERVPSPAIKPVVFYLIIGLFGLLFLLLIFFVLRALYPQSF